MIRVASIGECMIELRHRSATVLDLAYGGDTLNTAVYLARLTGDRNVRIDYVSALGDDAYSDGMLAMWRAERIGVDLVARLPGRLPGLHTIRTDARGERSFTYWRSASAARDMLRGPRAEQVARGAYRLRSPLSLRHHALDPRSAAARGAGRDRGRGARARRPGGVRRQLSSRRLARSRCGAHRVRPDARAGRHRPADARRRAGSVRREGRPGMRRPAAPAAASPRSRSSCGQAGCFLSSAQFTGEIPAEPVDVVVDSTAAGDSFNAGYLAARLHGADPPRAARLGNRARRTRHRLSRRDHPGRGHGGHPARVTGEASPPMRGARAATSRRCCARTPGRRARRRSTGRRSPGARGRYAARSAGTPACCRLLSAAARA